MSSATAPAVPPPFQIGQLVNVDRRAWVGINQPGGVGHVTAITHHQPKNDNKEANHNNNNNNNNDDENDDTKNTTSGWFGVSVKYVIGRRTEHNIHVKYVHSHEYVQGRRNVLGRCDKCGSLRRDCGSCVDVDVINEDHRTRRRRKDNSANPRTVTTTAPTSTTDDNLHCIHNDDDDDDDSLDELLEELSRFDPGLGNMRKKQKKLHKAIHSNNKNDNTDRELKRRASSKQGKRKPKRRKKRQPTHASVLETIGSPNDGATTKTTLHVGSPQSFATRDTSSETEMDTQNDIGDEEDDEDGGIGNEEVGSFPYPSDDENDMDSHSEMEDDDNDFIQPEGNAGFLPRDILDQTKQIPYPELTSFFDRTAQALETQAIPKARRTVVELQQQLNNNNQETMDWDSAKETYNELEQTLVRDGRDQCEIALRKLSDERLFRKHRAAMNPAQRAECQDLRLMARENRCDHLDKAIEDVLSQFRDVLERLEETEEDEAFEEEEDDDDDGFADPMELSPLRQPEDDGGQTLGPETQRPQSPFDPHQHAQVKKKGYRSCPPTSRRRRNNATARRRHSTRTKCSTESHESEVIRDQYKETTTMKPKRARKATSSAIQQRQNCTQTFRSSSSRRVRNKESAIAAMERFVASNAELLEPSSREGGDQDDVRENRPRERQLRLEQRPLRALAHQEDAETTSQTTDTVSTQQMFAVLRQRGTPGGRLIETEENMTGSEIEALCLTVSREYPNQSSFRDLRKLTDLLVKGASIAYVSTVRKSLMAALQKHGNKVLQEFIARNSPELKIHTQLLAACVALVHVVKDENDNGTTNDVFSGKGGEVFVDLTVQQLVEAVMSLSLPSAWALQDTDPQQARVMKEMNCLLETLALHHNLMERVSSCIQEELQPQQWRISEAKDLIFLSCVDPVSWSKALHGRLEPTKPSSSSLRFSVLGSVLPSSEIEAIWRSLAFAAVGPRIVPTNGVCFWKLLDQILLGSLVPSNQSDLSPGPSQLRACQEVLGRITEFIQAGSLDDLGLKDSFLANAVRKVIKIGGEALQEEDCQIPGAERTKVNNEAAEEMSAKMGQIFTQCDDDFPTKETTPPSLNGLVGSLSLVESQQIEDLPIEMRLLLPSSNLTCVCLSLILALVTHVPPKKVRINSLLKKTRIFSLENPSSWVRQTLLQLPDRTVPDEKDAFLMAFSTAVEKKTEITAKLHYLEFASYFDLLSAMTLGGRQDLPHGFSKPDAGAVGRTIWNHLADDKMKERRIPLARGLRSENSNYQGDLLQVQTTAKIMTILLLGASGVSPFQSSSDFEQFTCFTAGPSHREDLQFLVSSLLACLDCSCQSESSLESMFVVLGCIGVLVARLRRVSRSQPRPANTRKEAAEAILKEFSHNYPGIVAGCLGLLLQARISQPLQQRTLWLALQVLLMTESPSARVESTPESDVWGGIDDSLIAQLPESYMGTATKAETCIAALLMEALVRAKPSTRHSDVSDALISVPGRIAAAKYMELLSQSLAKVQTAIVGGSSDFLPRRSFQSCHDDLVYHRRAHRSYLVALSNMKKLDTFSPSQQLEGVVAMASETQLLRVLREFSNKGKLSGLVEKRHQQNTACRGLLAGFVASTGTSLDEHPPELQPTMEKVLLERIRLVGSLISCSCTSEHFQILCNNLLSGSASELLHLLNSMNFVNSSERKIAKRQDVARCYALALESWVSLLALEATLKEVESPSFRCLLHRHFVTPILKESGASDVLKHVISKQFQNGKIAVNSNIWGGGRTPSSFYLHLARRSRELILCFAIDLSRDELHVSRSSYMALLHSCHSEDIAALVASSFQPTFGETEQTQGSDFAEAVGAYHRHLEQEKNLRERLSNAVAELWSHTMNEVLLPQLCYRTLEGSHRLAMLQLLCHVVDKCACDDAYSAMGMNLDVVCSACAAIVTSFSLTLAAPVVRYEELRSTLLCMKSLLGLPARNIENGNMAGWLLDWCQAQSYHSQDKRTDACNFISVSAQFFKRSSAMLIDTAQNELQQYRHGIRELQNSQSILLVAGSRRTNTGVAGQACSQYHWRCSCDCE